MVILIQTANANKNGDSTASNAEAAATSISRLSVVDRPILVIIERIFEHRLEFTR